MRKTFGKTIVKLAKKDPNIVLLTGDVVQEMDEFRELFPNRFWNIGICEQSITSIAAGMAIEGLRPVIYSLTPFVFERPFEQIKVDIDEQNLPVMLIGYSDYPTHGPTHRALNEQGLIGLFKNVVGFFPTSSEDAEKAVIDAYLRNQPSAICLHKIGLPFF